VIRVALIGDFPSRADRVTGGVQAAFVYLVRGLVDIEDLDVHVLTFGDPATWDALTASVPGATFHRLPPFQRFEFARNFRTYQRTIDALLGGLGPDVVHAQGATDHAYVALRSGIPVVITVHGVQGEDRRHQPTLSTRLRKQVYAATIERYNLRHTRYLIAIGTYVTDYFAPLLAPEVRVFRIANAVDQSFFELDHRPVGGRILFAGRVNRRKRPLDLVTAFARIAPVVPKAELRLAGDLLGEPETVAEVRRVIDASGIAGRVHLLGSLSEAEIRAEFAQADVLVLPSGQETTPMVIAQAMAVGMPVVATRVGGVAEMVDDGRSGALVDVGDVDGLADAMARILAEPATAAAMGAAGQAIARADYTQAAVSAATAEVYRIMSRDALQDRGDRSS